MDEEQASDRARAAASWLLRARREGPGAAFPEEMRPRDAAEAVAVQRLVLAEIGPIGGWKVGAAGPEAVPSCAPLPASGIYRGDRVFPAAAFTTREAESEIAFVMGRDLPPRDAPYGRDDVLDAIASCHPGVELLQSRFAGLVDPLSNLADLIRHGAYVLGAPIAGWRAVDFAEVEVRQTIGDAVITRRGNPAGDMIRLVQWLADAGARWAGGLRAGDVVTCGSWTGATPVPVGGAVVAAFSLGERVRVGFEG